MRENECERERMRDIESERVRKPLRTTKEGALVTVRFTLNSKLEI